MKKENGSSIFSQDIMLKQNYMVIFISLSLVNICQNYIGLYVFSYPQCIVSQEDFQHKILNWSTFSLFYPYIQVGQNKGGRNCENCL